MNIFIKFSAFVTATVQSGKNWVSRLTICLVLSTILSLPQGCKKSDVACNVTGPTQDLAVYMSLNGNASNQACGVSTPANSLFSNNLMLTTDRNNVPNGAYQFNGTNSLLYLDNVNYGANVTLSCWVKPDNLNQNAVILYYGNSGKDGFGFGMGDGGCGFGKRQVVVLGGNNCDLTGPTPAFTDTNWTHLVLTKQDNTFSFYVNGSLKASKTGQAAPSTGRLYIGGDSSPALYNGYFTGKIDEVRVYNRALSSSEVATLYAL